MTRQEEFDNAVKTIQKLLQQRLVVADCYGTQKPASQIVIRDTFENPAKPIYWYNSEPYDNRETGLYIDEQYKLKIIEPTDVLRKELSDAKKAHAEALRKASQINSDYVKAQDKVRELEQKLVQLGEIK